MSAERLPQYGFGPETEYKTLIGQNRFLFRVHTPKSTSSPRGFFTALKFDHRYNHQASSPDLDPPPPTYADVGRHMEWTTRYSSPYIFTSFSFMWAVWDALLRYHRDFKHDVEIAIIDAVAVAGKSTTAVELLRLATPNERHRKHWKWYHFAQESQSVLVYGDIPSSAVLASVPILNILDKLPSYCLRYRSSRIPEFVRESNPLDRIAWTYLPKPNYRKFCEEVSALFLSASPEVRFRDSTVGSVRLALAFLGVWFHRTLQQPTEQSKDIHFDPAVAKLYELARNISIWPAGSSLTVSEREMWNCAIHAVVVVIAEEVKDTYRRIHGAQRRETPRGGYSPVSSSEPEAKKKSLPRSPDTTIPAVLDPRNYLLTPPPSPPPPPHLFLPDSTAAPKIFTEPPTPTLSPQHVDDDRDIEPAADLNTIVLDTPQSPRPAIAIADPPSESPRTKPEIPIIADANAIPDTPAVFIIQGLPHSFEEIATCLLTGFFFGALLVVVLSQRRPALLHVS